METFTIYPILGVKNDVPADDPSMFMMVGDGVAKTHCADGRNIKFSGKRNTCSKSDGKAQWSNSATTTTQNCLGIFELYDGTNRVIYIFMGDGGSNGRVFRYDSSRDPVRISDVAGHSGAVEFSSGSTDFYCPIKYGGYMVFSDFGDTTPYCADYNDTTLSKLISSGTEYVFRYLESWQRRIIGAYSGQTNGDIEIRWSNANPSPGTDCTFDSGNQLYVPNDDSITGIKKMGRNQCFLYCENSINSINYLGNYSSPFGIQNVVSNIGATNHHSIIDIGNTHFFYNNDYAFCSFDGGNVLPISDDIEDWTSQIAESNTNYIIGAHIPSRNEVAWTVPIEGSTSPNTILFFNYRDKQWRRVDLSMRYIANYLWRSNMSWNDLSNYGYTNWTDFGDIRWVDLVNEEQSLMMSNTDGQLYYHGTGGDDGSDWDGYRVEPIMDFGRREDKSLLLEIWFNLADVGNYNMYCYHRFGNTVGECKGANWVALDEISCNSPSNAVTYLAKTGRYHQIKWGTDEEGEPFSVHSIQFKYAPQGRY